MKSLLPVLLSLTRLTGYNLQLKGDGGSIVAATTRKWSIPDDEKDVGIKNVGNKGFPDAVNNASGDASGKQSFPTHHKGVGKYTLGKGTETERGKERKSRDRRRDFCCPSAAVPLPSVAALPRRCPSPPSATLGCVGYPAVMIAFVVWRGTKTMDKGWMKLRNKLSLEYRHVVTQFLEFAKFHVDVYGRLRSIVIMSYRRSNFMETDDMFLQFEDDLENIAGGSSSVGDNTESSSQQTTPTPRRRAQS
uniref:CACTA en-spm transposon protein n=1 Tax=Cucumis melo TaxID=3656 RepID=A0A9I9E5Y9_CUCME